MNRISLNIPVAVAVLLGSAIPALIFGRAVFAGIALFALVLILADMPWRHIRQALFSQSQNLQGLLLIGVFVFCIPSIFASNFPFRSFEAVTRTITYCGIGVVVWAYLKNRPELSQVWMQSLIISSAIAITFGLFSQYITPELYWFLHLKGWKSDPLLATLKGYTSLSVFLVPLLVYTAYKTQNLYALAALVVAACFLALLWNLANRATIAGLLGAIIYMVIAFGARAGSKWQVILATGFSIICFSGILIWLRITRGQMLTIAPEGNYFLPVWLIDFERQTIWTSALEIALRNPWFGRGANTINFAPGADKLIKGTHGLHVIPAHPHNWPLELFAELGAICLCVLLIFLLVWGVQLIWAYRRKGEAATLCAIAIFAGYWSSGLFNFSFWSSWWQLAFILSMALSLSMISTPDGKKPS